ncbi:hypothetical protein Tco_0195371, partial [Tanacetum coccineum]
RYGSEDVVQELCFIWLCFMECGSGVVVQGGWRKDLAER